MGKSTLTQIYSPLHPAGRPATADEIVEAIVFLAQSPPSTAGRAAI
jgi:hypothetical protein